MKTPDDRGPRHAPLPASAQAPAATPPGPEPLNALQAKTRQSPRLIAQRRCIAALRGDPVAPGEAEGVAQASVGSGIDLTAGSAAQPLPAPGPLDDGDQPTLQGKFTCNKEKTVIGDGPLDNAQQRIAWHLPGHLQEFIDDRNSDTEHSLSHWLNTHIKARAGYLASLRNVKAITALISEEEKSRQATPPVADQPNASASSHSSDAAQLPPEKITLPENNTQGTAPAQQGQTDEESKETDETDTTKKPGIPEYIDNIIEGAEKSLENLATAFKDDPSRLPRVKLLQEQLPNFLRELQAAKDELKKASPTEMKRIEKQDEAAWKMDSLDIETVKKWEAAPPEKDDNARAYLRKIEMVFTALSAESGGGFSAAGRAEAIECKFKKEDPSDDTEWIWKADIGKGPIGKPGHVAYTSSNHQGDSNPYEKSNNLESKSSSIAALDKNGSKDVHTAKYSKSNPIASAGRGDGQIAAMENVSANIYALHHNITDAARRRWEWLHIRAASLGGPTNASNLVLGTRDCNTFMMPFESNIAAAGKFLKEKDLRLNVTWSASDRTGKAAHAYNSIKISWQLLDSEENHVDSREAKFSPLAEASPLSKDHIYHLQGLLKAWRTKHLE